MRKFKAALALSMILTMALLILPGCPAKQQKPAPGPSPLPGKVTLQTIKPSDAPGLVKDLIAKQKDRESFNVVKDGGSYYAVVTRGKVPFKNFDVKFKDVEKIDLGNGNSQIRVQVTFTVPDIFPGKNTLEKGRGVPEFRQMNPEQRKAIKDKLGTKGEFYPLAVAKLNINTIPSAFTYSVLHERDLPQDVTENVGTTPSAQNQAPQTPQSSVQPTATTITVTTPPPNATVTSPLTVSGRANTTMITVDLKDDQGKVLASKTVGVTGTAQGQSGEFSTVLSYTPLTKQVQGTLEVYNRTTSGTKEGTVTVPVTIR